MPGKYESSRKKEEHSYTIPSVGVSSQEDENKDYEEFDKEMSKHPTIRIAMLGAMGSGKTSFICGIIQAFVQSTVTYKDINIELEMIGLYRRSGEESEKGEKSEKGKESVTSKEIATCMTEDESLRSFFAADFMRNHYTLKNEFIGSTDNMSNPLEIYFKFIIGDCHVCNVVISDYAGELVYKANQSSEVDSKQRGILANQINNADVILALVDGKLIKDFEPSDDPMEPYSKDYTSTITSTGLDFINMYASSYINEKNIKTLLIALTKTDSGAIPQRMKDDNFAGISRLITQTVCRGIYNRCEKNKWKYGVIPVSSIGDNAKLVNKDGSEIQGKVEQIQGKVEQKNIDLAILYAIYCSFDRLIAKAYNNIIAEEEKGVFKKDKAQIKKLNGDVLKYKKAKNELGDAIMDECNRNIYCRPAAGQIIKKL